MAGIPTSVQADAAKADEYIGGAQENAPAPEQGTPSEQPVSAPQEPNTSGQQTEARQEQTPQPQQSVSPMEAQAQSIEELQAEVARLTQSNTVLKTKYDAEVPRFAEDKRALRDENELLKERISTLESRPTPPPEVTTEQLKSIFSEDTLDAFSEDTLREFVQAQQMLVGSQLSEQQEELAKLRKELRSEMTETSEQAFNAQIFDRIPNMRTLDADDAFNDWLDLPLAAGSLTSRREDFNKAYHQHDINALAGIVEAYQPPQSQAQTLAASSGLPVTPNVQSQIVAPAEGTIVDPTPPAEGKSYSRQEYATQMNQLAIGAIKGDAAKRLQEELDQALIKGLIK